jgi:hypothetical protein
MKINSLLHQPAKAVLKHTQSRRFATTKRLANDAKRLHCGGSPPLFHRRIAALAVLFLALGATAQTTNALSDTEIRGRQLAQQLCEMRPTENFTNAGLLKVRGKDGKQFEVPVTFRTELTPATWQTIYTAELNYAGVEMAGAPYAVKISHHIETNEYEATVLFLSSLISEGRATYIGSITPGKEFLKFPPVRLENPFAGSDFWLCDLGLEFFHWPDQDILRGETMSGRFCKVLESTNPNPATNGYSRVVSWIDNESSGIVQAKAYDAKGKLLKSFFPKDIKKVDGQWQVGSMTIDNIQTGSRTTLKFDLKAK